MTENKNLMLIDILNPESKPKKYKKTYILPDFRRKYDIKTSSGVSVGYSIVKTSGSDNDVSIEIPANTKKLYVYVIA